MIDRKDSMASVVDTLTWDHEHPVIAMMEAALKYDMVPYLEGPPGAAKSSLVYQLCEKHDWKVVEIRPVLEDLSGLKGLPNFDKAEDGQTVVSWAIPKHFPRDPDWEGIIFIDEVVQAAVSMQAALTQLTLDRRVGDYFLPKGAKVVLAGNRTKDRASVNRMPTHLANRITRIPVSFHLKAWQGWAKKIGLPDVAIAFAEFQPQLLDSFDPKLEINCTPRSFAKAAPLIEIPRAIGMPLIQGAIGDGPAAQYVGFSEAWEAVPTLEAVCKKGKTLEIPEKGHVRYAIASKLAGSANIDNFESIMGYMGRFSLEDQAVFIKMVPRHDASLVTTETFGRWISENEEYLI